MRVSVKALSIASTIIWFFFIAFSVSLAYSASAIKIEISETKIRLDSEKLKLFLDFQVLIDNNGFYDLNNVEIKATLYDWHGSFLVENKTFVRIIPYGSKVLLTLELMVDLSDIFELVVGSNNPLLLKYEARINYASILPVKVYGSVEIMLQSGEI